MAGHGRWYGWLLLLVALAVGGPATAEEPGDASLALQGGRAGQADVELFVYRRLSDPDRLRAVMHQTFGVEIDDSGADGEEDGSASSFVMLTAEDVPLFAREGLTRSMRLDLGPLLQALRNEGFPSLEVDVSHFRAGFGRSSLGPPAPAGEHGRVRYTTRLRTDGSAPPLTAAYGYTAVNVLGILLALGAVLAVPVLLILRLRRAALQAEVADPAAIWFAYVRFSNGLTFVMWLAWAYVSALLDAGSIVGLLLPARRGMASVTMQMGAFLFPPAATMLLCSVLSYPVHARVRGLQWTASDLARQTFWSLAIWALPVLMLLAGMGAVGDGQSRAAASLFVGAFLVSIVARLRLMKAMELTPHALETGELRDRVFTLAAKAKVRLRQIYVLPAGKGNLANAFASHAGQVLLSDYLLRTLSKREVDAVMAHEVAHIRRRHPTAMRLAFALAIAVPIALAVVLPMDRESATGRLVVHVPLVMAACFLLVYGLSRRLERSADAMAAELTGDPEAMITSLAKLMRLNLMPLEWGRWFERTITHPSTERRASALARRWGIPPERVSELLANPESDGEHYTIPATTLSEETIFSTAFKHRSVSRIAWGLTAILTVAPALFYAAADLLRPGHGGVFLFLQVTGATFVLYLVATLFLPLWGSAELHRRLRLKMESDGIPVGDWLGTYVGYAPGAHPRLYEGYTNWDIGFLFLAGDRLCFVGEQTRFAIPAAHIIGVWLGQGPPSWWRTRRLCIAWRDPGTASEGVFNVYAADARSLRDLGRRTEALAERVQAWWRDPEVAARLPSALATLPLPGSVEVTSISPRAMAGCAMMLNSTLQMLFLSMCASALFGLHFITREENLGWGALFATLVCACLQWLPYVRYRDRHPKGFRPEADSSDRP